MNFILTAHSDLVGFWLCSPWSQPMRHTRDTPPSCSAGGWSWFSALDSWRALPLLWCSLTAFYGIMIYHFGREINHRISKIRQPISTIRERYSEHDNTAVYWLHNSTNSFFVHHPHVAQAIFLRNLKFPHLFMRQLYKIQIKCGHWNQRPRR